jgi:hypothetical protein
VHNLALVEAAPAPVSWWGGVLYDPPILDLPPALKGFELGAIAYLLGVMISPDDAALAEQWIEYHRCEALRLSLKEVPSSMPVTMTATEMLRLGEGPRLPDIYPSLTKAAFDGGVCGQMLLFILAELRAGQKASLQRAYEFIAAELVRQQKGRASKPTLIKMWHKYSAVAHLYGAFQAVRNVSAPTDGPRFPCSVDALPMFLAAAEALRRWGESFTPTKGVFPLLAAARTWRVPPNLKLPSVDINGCIFYR